jgi:hypothetical protein
MVGTPISTAGLGLADVESLKARVRAEIERLRGRLAAVRDAPPAAVETGGAG